MNDNIMRVQNLLYDDTDDIDSHARSKNNLASQDIGVINQLSGAGVTADQEGNINLASDNNLGIYINKSSREITLIADRVRVLSADFKVNQTPYYYISDEEKEVLALLGNEG